MHLSVTAFHKNDVWIYFTSTMISWLNKVLVHCRGPTRDDTSTIWNLAFISEAQRTLSREKKNQKRKRTKISTSRWCLLYMAEKSWNLHNITTCIMKILIDVPKWTWKVLQGSTSGQITTSNQFRLREVESVFFRTKSSDRSSILS